MSLQILINLLGIKIERSLAGKRDLTLRNKKIISLVSLQEHNKHRVTSSSEGIGVNSKVYKTKGGGNKWQI